MLHGVVNVFWVDQLGVPGVPLVAQMVKSLPAMQETWIPSPGWENLEDSMAIHSSFLAGESYGQGSLVATTHGIHRVEHD